MDIKVPYTATEIQAMPDGKLNLSAGMLISVMADGESYFKTLRVSEVDWSLCDGLVDVWPSDGGDWLVSDLEDINLDRGYAVILKIR